MKKLSLVPILCLVLLSCSITGQPSDSSPVDHDIWDELVSRHVKSNGRVDYKGFIRDSVKLNSYLDLLSGNHPNSEHWSREESMAYWINAYNAFTVKLIVDNYPVESIKDVKRGIPMVNSVWDIKFIEIEGQEYDLNNIEHSILRKEYDEPRIHFAVNCASVSCPDLLNEAYTPDKLESQLNMQARRFLSDESKNRISENQVEISKIFQWFKGDFTKEGSLIEFLDKYTDTDIDEKAKVGHLSYDWNLNE